MENNNMAMDWSWLIGLLIIGGIFGYGNGGFGGNNARNDISNEFLYNQMANDIRANGQAISGVDRDVLENRFSNQLGLQNLQALQSSCCCELKTAIHSEGEATRSLITQNRIADLEKDLVNANTIISNATQTQNILNSLGTYYPKSGVNPYAVYGYGTTIY